jgi:hypothetical protein
MALFERHRFSLYTIVSPHQDSPQSTASFRQMRSHITLAVLGTVLAAPLASVLAVDSTCWSSGNWVSPRSNADTCASGLYAWKQDDMTACFAPWRDYVGDELQKDCMPKPVSQLGAALLIPF